MRFTIDGIGQLVSGDEGLHRQRQFQTVETASLRLGRHWLGFGIDYRRVSAIRRDAAGVTEAIAGSVAALTDLNQLWKTNSAAVSQNAELTEYSLWAQDTWQIGRRLTLTYGMRWEFSPPPDTGGSINVYDPVTGQVAATNAPLWPTSYHNLAPRFGAALRLTRDGRTVLRAGGGLYYDSSLSIATDVLDGGPFDFAVDIKNGSRAPFSFALQYGFEPNLKLPQIRQWNVTLERAVTSRDALSLGYVGVERPRADPPRSRWPRQRPQPLVRAHYQQRLFQLSGAAVSVPPPALDKLAGLRRLYLGAFHRQRFERRLSSMGRPRRLAQFRLRLFRFRSAPRVQRFSQLPHRRRCA